MWAVEAMLVHAHTCSNTSQVARACSLAAEEGKRGEANKKAVAKTGVMDDEKGTLPSHVPQKGPLRASGDAEQQMLHPGACAPEAAGVTRTDPRQGELAGCGAEAPQAPSRAELVKVNVKGGKLAAHVAEDVAAQEPPASPVQSGVADESKAFQRKDISNPAAPRRVVLIAGVVDQPRTQGLGHEQQNSSGLSVSWGFFLII